MSDPGYPESYSHSELTYTYSGTDNGAPLIGDGGYWAWMWRYGDKVSVETPGWPVKPPPFNPYLRVGSSVSRGSVFMHDSIISGPKAGQYHVDIVANPIWLEGSNPPVPIITGVNPDELDVFYNQVMNKLMDKLAANRVNLGEFYATRQQTANLVIDTANRIYRSVHQLRRGNFRAAQEELGSSSTSKKPKWARTIGEQWLAIQYGWKPLLGDVKEAAEQLSDVANQFKPELTAYVSLQLPHDDVIVDHSGGSVAFGIPGGKWTGRASTLAKGFLEFKLSSNFGAQLARTGLSNPYSVAWELLPWSFVVDWFYPIGPFLERTQYDQGLVFSRGWYSRKTIINWALFRQAGSVNIDVGNGNILHREYSGGLQATGTNSGYVRDHIPIMPLPTAPKFKDPFSTTHVLNAIALMASGFSGKGTSGF
jgi:hypothetical protein